MCFRSNANWQSYQSREGMVPQVAVRVPRKLDGMTCFSDRPKNRLLFQCQNPRSADTVKDSVGITNYKALSLSSVM